MEKANSTSRSEMRKAIELEIDELARARVKAAEEMELVRLKDSRVWAGLADRRPANAVQMFFQRLCNTGRHRENLRVLEMVRGASCDDLIQREMLGGSFQNSNPDHKMRLELLYEISAELGQRNLQTQKTGFDRTSERIAEAEDAVSQKASVAKEINQRVEAKIVQMEEEVRTVAKLPGWSVDNGAEIMFSPELFELFERRISELETTNLESEKMLQLLPVVNLESLPFDDLKSLASTFEAAAAYFHNAHTSASEAVESIDSTLNKIRDQIAQWQKRHDAAASAYDEKEASFCAEYIGGYQSYLTQYFELLEQAKVHVDKYESKMLRVDKGLELVNRHLAEIQQV